ncbi:2-oxo-4-hydroxy-4-carboxy-5-ureidoimidazoline decarboxylase [Rothia aerolata]|uniref:2-oxo-4-hydroxy-4-carboxy-5-ureidoimidazoline decarboxylase n=1 Tax=Rothia aerolata TaxID=1812262 RepID=A0A917IWY1_9MICC|nr:2-oxo-4-hydroxy-4-carboxy-5-ureidoimidazoline decarboxylase [Rothia aerolata]GGH65799.1 OHCU decarboxylase [Rothia aerolata]
MNLKEFNETSSADLQPHLKACVSIPAFSHALINQRPYLNRQDLLETAKANIATWSAEEVTEALSQHPRIGEKKAPENLSVVEAENSRQEQQGVQDSDLSTWESANASYEKQFGHVFLIRADGRDSAEMLSELKRRMKNSPQQEELERKQQLGEISLLRLEKLVNA